MSVDNGPALESWAEKAIRHVKAGEIDPATLLRGIKRLGKMATTRYSDRMILNLNERHPNFANMEDLNVYVYEFRRPLSNAPRHQLFSPERLVTFNPLGFVIEFPYYSRLEVVLEDDFTPYANLGPAVNRFDELHPKAFAAVTGPTQKVLVQRETGRIKEVANNGFYTEKSGLMVPFADTNPSGLRRGALAVTKDDQLVLMDDQMKWQAVRNNFDGYAAVAGTSYYFEDEHFIEGLKRDNGRCELSYLFQYFTEDQRLRTAYTAVVDPITRQSMTKLIKSHIMTQNGRLHRAVELEHTGSGGYVRTPSGIEVLGSTANMRRHDHYLFFPTRSK